jgi:TIR domain
MQGGAMADIFLSYKSEDRLSVQLLAAVFGAEGYSVWYDKGLRADDDYYKQLESELDDAEIVVAIWSTRSHDSRWVYAEADKADKAGKLINASVDGTIPPMPFNRKNSIDLTGWAGDHKDSRVQTLIASARSLRALGAGETPKRQSTPIDSAAARAWMLIADSTTMPPYEDFVSAHGAAPHADLARDHLRALKRWERVDKDDPFAIRAFIQTGPYAALGALAKAQIPLAKEAYIKKKVSWIIRSMGTVEEPNTLLGGLGMLTFMPVIICVAWACILAPFFTAAGLVWTLMRKWPEVRTTVEGILLGIQSLSVWADLHIDMRALSSPDVAVWVLAAPLGLIVLCVFVGLLAAEATRITKQREAEVRDYYSKKVAPL